MDDDVPAGLMAVLADFPAGHLDEAQFTDMLARAVAERRFAFVVALSDLEIDGSQELLHSGCDGEPVWTPFTPRHHLAAYRRDSSVFVLVRAQRPSVDVVVPRALLARLVADVAPCRYDLGGNCVEHAMVLGPGERCPVGQARQLLA